MPKFIVIIPARYQSTRFPGKPLALIGEKPMIEHVYRQASKAADEVWVATDDSRISEAVERFGGRVVMTRADHNSGTDRLREAAEKLLSSRDDAADYVIINVQGDEPFIDPEQIGLIKSCFNTPSDKIATLARPFDASKGFDALSDPNLVKIVFGEDMNAIYFSRSVIPYVRGAAPDEWLNKTKFFSHIGVYAYRYETLLAITDLKRSPLEIAESLEQLRWLQNGYRIKVAVSDHPTIGIDTPGDLEAARRYWQENVCNS